MIEQTIESLPFLDNPIFDGIVDAIMTLIEDIIVNEVDGKDAFLFGNTEIDHIYTNNTSFFNENMGVGFDTKTYS
jgi:hypothetical protein